METDCSISLEEISKKLNKDLEKAARKFDKALDDLVAPNVEDVIKPKPVELCTCGNPLNGEAMIYIGERGSVWKICKCKPKTTCPKK